MNTPRSEDKTRIVQNSTIPDGFRIYVMIITFMVMKTRWVSDLEISISSLSNLPLNSILYSQNVQFLCSKYTPS